MKELHPDLAERLALIAGILLRCFLTGILLVTLWFLVFLLAGDELYGLHARWFNIPRDAFDTLHYGAMAATKLTVILLFLIPYIAIRLQLKRK